MWVVGTLRGHEFERVEQSPFFIDARQAEAWARRHLEENPGITISAGAITAYPARAKPSQTLRIWPLTPKISWITTSPCAPPSAPAR